MTIPRMMKPRQAAILIMLRMNSTEQCQTYSDRTPLVHGFQLTFAVATDTKDLDDAQDDQEDGNPHAHADVFSPVFDCNRRRDQLEGENGQPGECVIPAHSEAPTAVVSSA